jgi:alkylation response protein AidB-like acyl-CoA dehydrogenase
MTGETSDILTLDGTELSAWIAAHPRPSGAELAAAGLVAPHWPRPYGLAATPAQQLTIDRALADAGIESVDNPIGIGWAGPTLLHAGTVEQQRRFLPPLLDGSEFWCQLFSEPDAGSDLASLRTRAHLDGDTWVVNGQKIWTTWADRARWGILLARTEPDQPRHRGISYFICPMDDPGIEIRPIREMSGGRHFNEVFLHEVRIPRELLVGERGDGWRLAKVTLGNERVSLSSGGLCWGMGPTTEDLFDLIRERGGISDPVLRQRAAAVAVEAFHLDRLGEQVAAALLAGGPPGPEASMKKFRADLHGQEATALALDLRGTGATLHDIDTATDPDWGWAYLFSRALTIGGGTSEVQRNILAEQILGLPREPR